YLCNALDKGNVGNAKTDNWDKDVGLVGNQTEYIFLVLRHFAQGSKVRYTDRNLREAILRRSCVTDNDDWLWVNVPFLGDSKELFGWVMLGTLRDFTHTCLQEIFAIRFFLGIFESAMLPGVREM
ncbi:hypothetical protein MPER_01081, partial [Moniliophthora perniciosa FA553]